jgi:hypothetical protein
VQLAEAAYPADARPRPDRPALETGAGKAFAAGTGISGSDHDVPKTGPSVDRFGIQQ